MRPQTDQSVTFSVSALPKAVADTFDSLGITFNTATVPQILATLTQKCPQWLMFFYTLLYQQLINENGNHLLVRIKQIFDFSALDAAAASYHKNNGLGKPPKYTPPQLVRLLLLRWLLGWSYRVTADRAKYNWLARWFADFPLTGDIPSHSTISDFEKWLQENHPELFFVEVVRQVAQAFPDDDWKTQIGDTFACLSRGLFETIPRLVRHTCHLLLKHLAKADPELYSALFHELDMDALFGTEQESREFFWSKEQRAEISAVIVRQALALVEWLPSRLDKLPPGKETDHVLRLVRQLEKILKDDFVISFHPETGELIDIKKRTKRPKGTYRTGSTSDPQASSRVHGDRKDFGYNIALMGTFDFITSIEAFTGSMPDSATLTSPLHSFYHTFGFYPERLIYDRGAGWGKCLRQVSDATNGQTRLVVHLVPSYSRGRFGPDDFTLSEDGKSLTCPAGVTSTTIVRSGDSDGVYFRFKAPDCGGCFLVKECRVTKKKDEEKADGLIKPDLIPVIRPDENSAISPNLIPHIKLNEIPVIKGYRTSFVSHYREDVLEHRAYSLTERFREEMNMRPYVERLISALVNHNGAREAVFNGTKRVDYQMKMAATSYNLKRWVARLAQEAAPEKPKAPDTSLGFGRKGSYRLPAPLPKAA